MFDICLQFFDNRVKFTHVWLLLRLLLKNNQFDYINKRGYVMHTLFFIVDKQKNVNLFILLEQTWDPKVEA